MKNFFFDLPIERKLLLVSAVPVLTVFTLSFLTYTSVQTFSHDEDRLNLVYHIQSDSAEYMRLVVDLETGFRGFVLTKQPAFLKPYRAAKQRVHTVERALLQMVSPQSQQHALLRGVQQLVDQLLTDKDALILKVKNGYTNEAIQYIETGQGRELMSAIREKMAEFDRREVTQLQEALLSSGKDRDVLLWIVVGGGMVTLLLMFVSLHFIARSITSPLRSLARTVGGTSEGTVPQVSVLERQDEIGELTRVMHSMSTQTQEHINRIQHSEHELRMLNHDLAASEAKYRGIVDHAPIGIFTTEGTHVIFSNQANWELAGRKDTPQADPELMWHSVHEYDREQTYQSFVSSVEKGASFEKVFRFQRADGMVRKVFCRAIPITDRKSQPVVYQGFNVDITTLEQMRAKLIRSERLAMLGQVAAGIAHEIRNPLVGIGSTASLLLEELPDTDSHRADLTTILQETKRLDRIVNQIVDFAKPRTFAPQIFSLEEKIQEALRLLTRPLSEKEISVIFDKPDHLPSIEADQDQIKQILLNVLQNAIEALPTKGKLTIRLCDVQDHTEPTVQVDITDNGVGIAASDLPHLFEPFFTSGKPKGTGLGLAICRNIVDQHHGDMTVTSQKDHGTTISISLPWSQGSEAILT